MKKVLYKTLGVLALSAIAATTARAEHIFGSDQLDGKFGAAVRVRQEYWDNAFNLDDQAADRNYFRLKSSVWGKFDYNGKYGAVVKLTNESYYYLHDFHDDNDGSLDLDELVVDNLCVTAKDFLGMPVDLSIGRQDFLFTFGEGFLIMDGTPSDGSRTTYFNAARATVKINPDNNVDLVAISNTKYDDYLPSIHQYQKHQLNTSKETGFVVYGRSKINDNFSLEPYYIFKNEEEPAHYSANELDLHTFGARGVYTTGPYQVRAEYCIQNGDYDSTNIDRDAWGGYVFANRTFKDVPLQPKFELGFIDLSGDDPNTTDDEAFDPLFSRWPWLSELTIFTYTHERDIAYATNLQQYRARLWLNLTDATKLDVAYSYLRANENLATPGTGKDRGDLYQVKLSHKFTKTIDGYLLAEYFSPGDFYNADSYYNGDDAIFGRWQLQFKF